MQWFILAEIPSQQHKHQNGSDGNNPRTENDTLSSFLLLPPGKLALGRFTLGFDSLLFLGQA